MEVQRENAKAAALASTDISVIRQRRLHYRNGTRVNLDDDALCYIMNCYISRILRLNIHQNVSAQDDFFQNFDDISVPGIDI